MSSDLDRLSSECLWGKHSRDNQGVNKLSRSFTQKTGQSWTFRLGIIIIWVSVDEGMTHRKWNKKNNQRKEKNNRDLYILYKLKDSECPTKAEQAKVKLKFNLSLSQSTHHEYYSQNNFYCFS